MQTITGKESVSWWNLDSVGNFKQTMDKEFDYLVTQVCSHYKMSIASGDFEVERLYGSPGYEYLPPGVMLETSASNPSTKTDDATKGGIVVAKLKKVRDTNKELQLPIEYVLQNGRVVNDFKSIKFPTYNGNEIYEGPARKALLLLRLVNLLKYFIRDERLASKTKQPMNPSISTFSGILIPTPMTEKEKEIDSEVLVLEKISDHYKKLLLTFLDYFKKEVEIIGDSNLLQEIEIIEDILELKLLPTSALHQVPQQTSTSIAKYNHTQNYQRTIDKALSNIDQQPLLEDQSDTVELCFIMDATGSMGSYIAMCQQKVGEIVDIVTNDNPQTTIKIAFVAYWDHTDKEKVRVYPFTTDVSLLKKNISLVKANGGGDIPEDICGGLKAAVGLDWKTRRRLMIIIADAPCHGTMYHNEKDNYPTGDPGGLIPEVLLSQAAAKNIHVFFAKIKPMTDKMTSLWTDHMRKNHPSFPFNVFSIDSDVDFVVNITDAILSTAYL